MNTQYFLYAIEVERTGSITHAAKNLFMSQPTLSKAIKDLEETLGFAVFRRTSRGVEPTRRGAEFLAHARKISSQIRKMELSMQAMESTMQMFGLAIPRAGYIACAAARLTRFLSGPGMEIDILETGARRIVEAVSGGEYLLGILRCSGEETQLLPRLFADKGLQSEMFWEADYQLLVGEDSPLSAKPGIGKADLQGYTEVLFSDDEAPLLRIGEESEPAKRIFVQDRGTLYAVLRDNPGAFAWASPIPGDMLRREGLVQRKASGSGSFADVIISRAGRRLSRQDQEFLRQLTQTRNEALQAE